MLQEPVASRHARSGEFVRIGMAILTFPALILLGWTGWHWYNVYVLDHYGLFWLGDHWKFDRQFTFDFLALTTAAAAFSAFVGNGILVLFLHTKIRMLSPGEIVLASLVAAALASIYAALAPEYKGLLLFEPALLSGMCFGFAIWFQHRRRRHSIHPVNGAPASSA
jgi:hypothetical protein